LDPESSLENTAVEAELSSTVVDQDSQKKPPVHLAEKLAELKAGRKSLRRYTKMARSERRIIEKNVENQLLKPEASLANTKQLKAKEVKHSEQLTAARLKQWDAEQLEQWKAELAKMKVEGSL
jgi:galactokinase/mevalonate kinase-like predicted kinase